MLIVIGCLWLAVGALGVAAQLGSRLLLASLPEPDNGTVDIARVVLEPFLGIGVPLLFVALALGAVVQTVKLLVSQLRRRSSRRRRVSTRG